MTDVDGDFDMAKELDNLLKQDHEQTIAKWQAKADAAAAAGDERRRAWYQDRADGQRAIPLPWERKAS